MTILEEDIGFLTNGLLDTTMLTNFTGTGGSSNGYISVWYDQSGNNSDLIQSDTTRQPSIVTTGVVVSDNGTTAVQFDGSSTVLENNLSQRISAPVAINFIASDDGTTNCGSVFGTSSDMGIFSNAGANYAIDGTGANVNTPNTALTIDAINTGFDVITGVYTNPSTNNSYIYRDGMLENNYTGPGVYMTACSSFQVGAKESSLGTIGNYYKGKICELIVCDKTDEMILVKLETDQDRYINTKNNLPLLDRVGVTNVVGAYSLRKLLSSYSGNCIQVRRDSDNTVQDIGFTIDGSLDIDSLYNFVGTSNGYIVKWYDQSNAEPNGAYQSDPNKQPMIVSLGTLQTTNKRPTIKFGSANTVYGFLNLTNPLDDNDTITYENVAAVFDSVDSNYFPDNSGILGAANDYMTLNDRLGIYTVGSRNLISGLAYINSNYIGNNGPFNSSSISSMSGLRSVITNNSTAETNKYRIGKSDYDADDISRIWKGRISEMILWNGATLSTQSSTDMKVRNIIANDQIKYYGTQKVLDKVDVMNISASEKIAPISGAYSLRKLSNEYNGACITVSRTGPNPASSDIGFNDECFLDIDALTSFVGNNDGYVTRWFDQSGNGYDANQTDPNCQAQIISGGRLITQNGKVSLYFDGVDDCYTIKDANGVPVQSIACEVSIDGTENNYNGSDSQSILARNGDPNINLFYRNYQYIQGDPSSNDMIKINNVKTQFNSPQSVLKSISIAARESTSGINSLGQSNNGNYWKGYMSEIVLFNGDISANNIQTNLVRDQMRYYNMPQNEYLLDSIKASNIGVAYSTRKLTSTYTGAAIEVRRSSDNTTTKSGRIDSYVAGSRITPCAWIPLSWVNAISPTTALFTGRGTPVSRDTSVERP